ncbi:hypothetical protein GMPD_24710 [Geomonas paludis]|uniref:Uncharacterized protein n=1 Tax=Geomonas paludis TaxID=2740185 RepID=A0A6V8MWT1_9BACT|nr:hypothetical protein GMPD_24710 [Geomonas paludis]
MGEVEAEDVDAGVDQGVEHLLGIGSGADGGYDLGATEHGFSWVEPGAARGRCRVTVSAASCRLVKGGCAA